VEDAHARVVDPDSRNARSPDDIIPRGGMDGPVFIEYPVSGVVIDLAVLNHQVLDRSVGAKPIPFCARRVPARIVQVTVAHLHIAALICRVPMACPSSAGTVDVNAIGPGIGHITVRYRQIVRADRIHADLAGEKTAVAYD